MEIISNNSYYENRDAKMNSRKCDVCKTDVHRISYAKHLRIKKYLDNEKQNKMNIPEWLFQEPIEKKLKKYIMAKYIIYYMYSSKVYNSKSNK